MEAYRNSIRDGRKVEIMESPPYMPGPKKSKTGLIVGGIVAGVLFCCVLPIGLIGGGALYGWKKIQGTASCVFTFGDMKRAVQLYTAEHHGKLPDAEKWQDELRPYYKRAMTPKEQLGPFPQMQPEGDWGCKESDGTSTGMAFNSDVSGKDVSEIKDSENTVAIFETEHPAKNQHMAYKKLDPLSSPKIFNEPRGWFFVSVSGDVFTDSPKKGVQRMGNISGGGGFKIQTGSGN